MLSIINVSTTFVQQTHITLHKPLLVLAATNYQFSLNTNLVMCIAILRRAGNRGRDPSRSKSKWLHLIHVIDANADFFTSYFWNSPSVEETGADCNAVHVATLAPMS